MTGKFTDKAKFTFEHAPDFRTHHIDGVWGGPTNKGFLHANFFVDTPFLPVDVTLRAGEDGNAIQEAVTERPSATGDTADVRRTVTTAVLLSAEDAISIGQWMIAHGQALIGLREGSLAPEEFVARLVGKRE